MYYDKSYNLNEVQKILDISSAKYNRIRDELVDAGRIDRDYRSKRNPKYYCYNKGQDSYKVTRKLRGKQHHFITVPTEEMAKFCVDLFHRYGWRKQNVPYIRARLVEEFGVMV